MYLKSNDKFDPFIGIARLTTNNHINDFIKSKDHAVRIIFSGKSEQKLNECFNFDLPLEDQKFNNKILMTTVNDSIINHLYGVEAVRTSIVSGLQILDKTNKTKHSLKEDKYISIFEDHNYLNEKELIKTSKKWHLISKKQFNQNIEKPYWEANEEFVSAKIILENHNRESITNKDLKKTIIDYAIVIELENKKGIDNFQKIFNRLEINNFEPKILIEGEIEHDIDLKLT